MALEKQRKKPKRRTHNEPEKIIRVSVFILLDKTVNGNITLCPRKGQRGLLGESMVTDRSIISLVITVVVLQ